MAEPRLVQILCKENDVAKFLNYDFTPGHIYTGYAGRKEQLPGGSYVPLAIFKDNMGWWFQLLPYHIELGLFEIVEGETYENI